MLLIVNDRVVAISTVIVTEPDLVGVYYQLPRYCVFYLIYSRLFEKENVGASRRLIFLLQFKVTSCCLTMLTLQD